MKKPMVFIALVTFILTACSGQKDSSNAGSEVRDEGGTITATVGQEFKIMVHARRPSSGYHWEVAEAIDATVVEYIWKDFEADSPGNPDSSGREFWRFKPLRPGRTTIKLGLYLGMTDVATQILEFTIVIQ